MGLYDFYNDFCQHLLLRLANKFASDFTRDGERRKTQKCQQKQSLVRLLIVI